MYAAARSAQKTNDAINRIKAAYPNSTGKLAFLELDLSDLPTIKKSADDFLAAESKLDVLWLNAGVMWPPHGSKTAQGYELCLGTNNLGHFLFVKHLHDVLRKTAAVAPKDSVRVVWVSSSAAEMAPQPAINFDNMDYKRNESDMNKYGRSKAGNVLHSCEFARRTAGEGILNLSLNPGNLQTDLARHANKITGMLIKPLLHPAIYGAYTELFAGLSPDITEKDNGGWLQPWGRVRPIRKDLAEPELGKKFWDCEFIHAPVLYDGADFDC